MPIANKTTNKIYELESNSACCDENVVTDRTLLYYHIPSPKSWGSTILTRMFTFQSFQQWNCDVTTQANDQNLVIKTLSLKIRMWKIQYVRGKKMPRRIWNNTHIAMQVGI
jgi:hypothetical protein